MSDTENFRGKILQVRYYSEDNNFGVCVVELDKEIPYSKISLDYDIETNIQKSIYTTVIAGKMPQPKIGFVFDIEGEHDYVAKYKQNQYKIVYAKHLRPQTQDEQKEYLKAILTDRQTETLLSVYPTIVDDIINGNDEVDINLLSGIGESTWNNIKEKIIENFSNSEIISLLTPLGISMKKISKLLDGEKNQDILKEKLISNPYILTAVKGISFITCDKIAVQLNPSLMESETRLIAFIKYHLGEIGNGDGHCYIRIIDLKNEVIKIIPECEKFFLEYIEKEKENPKVLHIEEKKVGLLYYYNSEKFIYNLMNEVHASIPLEIKEENIDNGIKIAEEQQGFSYSDEQKNILIEMTKNNLNVLSGLAGSGKSSLSRGILNIYKNAEYRIGVCALSAKAAKRCSETTGFAGITIHRLLESNTLSFERNEHNKLEEYDVLLVDESSMINSQLAYSLFKAIDSSKTKIILVGDFAQLSPISYGQPFTDVCLTENKYQKNILTEVFRHAKSSGIFIDAMKIRKGESPISFDEKRVVHGGDMVYILSEDKEYLHDVALKSYLKAVEEDGIENVVLLVPRKNSVLNSTGQFNSEIQAIVNEVNLDKFYKYGNKKFCLNDWVIQTVNDKERKIFNGYMGRVVEIRNDGISVSFEGNIVKCKGEEVGQLDLGMSLSFHKSQGSQWHTVILVLDMNSFMLLSSQALYTGLTRSQNRAMLLAQPKAFKMCLKENKNQRKTWLKEFIENDRSS
jgi:exodeoxyribonuclease V alpha subunit